MPSIYDAHITEVPIAAPAVPPQLQALIAAEVARQVEPLVSEIATLEATNAALVDRLAVLEGLSSPPIETGTGEVLLSQPTPSPPDPAISEEIIQLRADLEMFNEARALEIATDRRRIAALEVPPEVHVQPKQRNQGDILRALLATTANGKMLQNTARAKMGISKSAFSRLLHTIEGSVKYEPYHKDRRQNVLVLVNKNE